MNKENEGLINLQAAQIFVIAAVGSVFTLFVVCACLSRSRYIQNLSQISRSRLRGYGDVEKSEVKSTIPGQSMHSPYSPATVI